MLLNLLIRKTVREITKFLNLNLNLNGVRLLKGNHFPACIKIIEEKKTHKIDYSIIFTNEKSNKLPIEGHINYDNIFIAEVDNGRVWGNQGAVILNNNIFFTAVSREYDSTRKKHSIFLQRRLINPKYYDKNVAVVASSGSEVYYHWMMDIVPRITLLKSHYKEPIDFWIINYNNLSFQDQILDLLDIPRNKIIPSINHFNFHICAKKLIIASHVSPNNTPSHLAIKSIRGLFQTHIPIKKQRKIYVKRNGGRHLINEKEVIETLTAMNFEIIIPEELTIEQQREVFSNSCFIVSPHGSALVNIVFAQKDTKVIDIFSPTWINPCYAILSNISNLKYGYLIGKTLPGIRENDKGANILIDVDDLKNLIKKMES